jgi:cytochrome c peroxidase
VALDKMVAERNEDDPAALPAIGLDDREREQLVAFLMTLTDPCIEDRACIAPWIPNTGDAADDHQLNAVDITGEPL